MKKILVFAGTTEGRMLVEALSRCCEKSEPGGQAKTRRQLPVTACVATEYGKALLPEKSPFVKVMAGRLLPEEMISFMEQQRFDAVVDTTHPYAVAVTENIQNACKETGTRYIRLLRKKAEPLLAAAEESDKGNPSAEVQDSGTKVHYVRDTAEAAAYLNQCQGKVLLTTGSKELEAFTAVKDYEQRLYPRVLPMSEVLKKCEELGFPGKHLICMQGPFSLEMNLALLKQTGAGCLVTKDSGSAGGFREKAMAAQQLGIELLVIGRQPGEDGLSFEETAGILEKELGFPGLRNIAAQIISGSPVDSAEESPAYFPLFVSIRGKEVLVAGGGKIATRRIKALLPFSCHITVVAPEATEELQTLAAEGKLSWKKEAINPENKVVSQLVNEIKPCFIIAATDQRELNQTAAEVARQSGIPVNVIDCKEECTFYFPGIARKGTLVAGITASGRDHRLAARAAEAVRECFSSLDHINGADLEYEPLCASHRDSLVPIWSDEDVILYTNIKSPCTPEEIADRIEILKNFDVFMVRRSGEAIGIIGSPCICSSKLQYGVFYQFRKSAWGQGYATEAAKWLIHFMKEKYPGLTLLADVVADNIASERILKRFDFELVSEEKFQRHGIQSKIRNYRL